MMLRLGFDGLCASPAPTVRRMRHGACGRGAAAACLLAAALGASSSLPPPARAQQLDTRLWSTNGSVSSTALSGNTLYVAGRFGSVGPNSGGGAVIDRATGLAVPGMPSVSGGVASIFTAISDGAGGWYVGGIFSAIGGQPRSNLAHIRADLSVDSWAPNPDSYVHALALAGDTVFVGGAFTSIGGQAQPHLAAVRATTGAVLPWGGGGANKLVESLLVDGARLWVSGQFTSVGGQSRGAIAALDLATGLAGSWDAGASNNGYLSEVRILALSGNTLYVGGVFAAIGGQPRSNVAALDATTGAATDWDPQPSGSISSMVVSGTTIYAGGSFTTIGGQPRNRLAAFDATTGSVSAWDPGANGNVSVLALNGATLYVGGGFTTVGGRAVSQLAALDVATGLASDWDAHVNAGGSLLALVADATRLYVGGQYTRIGWHTRLNLAAFDVTTGAVTDWNPSADRDANALLVDGATVYVGGAFTSAGGQARSRIAALDATTGLATPWNPGADNSVAALALSGSTVIAAGSFTAIGGQPRNDLAALDSTTGLATAWNPGANGACAALAVAGSTVYVGGAFSQLGGQPRSALGAVNAITGAPTDWNPGANVSVSALAVKGRTVYAGGAFTNIAGTARYRIAALDATTGDAKSWNPSADGTVRALLPLGTVLFAGGEFAGIGGQPRHFVAELDTSVGVASSWDPGVGSSVSALALGASSLYVGGGFTVVGGLPAGGIANLSIAIPPSVRVDSPAGGEFFAIGSIRNITWSASSGAGVTNVDLLYSTNGGASYSTLIVGRAPNTGTWAWRVPNTPSTRVRVKVVAHDSTGRTLEATSDDDFTIGPWIISASAGANGTIAPSGAVGVFHGGSVTFAIRPALGDAVADVQVDGASVGPVARYAFTSVTADHTIAASFAPAAYALGLATIGSGAVARAPDQPSYGYGATVALTATPAAGWSFAGWGGDTAATVNPLVLAMTRDRGVTATFADTTRPVATLLGPQGGEGFSVHATATVRWNASDNAGVSAVDLLLSRHGAAGPFDPIATAIPNSGAYAWTVTAPSTGVALLEVVARDAAGNAGTAVGGATFAILDPPGIEGGTVSAFALAEVAPNPVHGDAQFGFAVPEAAAVRLAILDLQGREVAVLADGEMAPGWHQVGLASAPGGRAVESGLYFLRYQSPGGTRVRRFVLTR